MCEGGSGRCEPLGKVGVKIAATCCVMCSIVVRLAATTSPFRFVPEGQGRNLCGPNPTSRSIIGDYLRARLKSVGDNRSHLEVGCMLSGRFPHGPVIMERRAVVEAY